MEAFAGPQIGYWLSTLNSQLSTRSSLRELFVNDLDLLIEYSAGEAIDRHVQPSNAAPLPRRSRFEDSEHWLVVT
jgi:hypothetical protein